MLTENQTKTLFVTYEPRESQHKTGSKPGGVAGTGGRAAGPRTFKRNAGRRRRVKARAAGATAAVENERSPRVSERAYRIPLLLHKNGSAPEKRVGSPSIALLHKESLRERKHKPGRDKEDKLNSKRVPSLHFSARP